MEKIYNMVDIETIEKLAAIVNSNDLGEITIVDGGKTITVKGKKCPPPPPPAGAAPAPMSCVPQSIPPMVSYADPVETAKQSDEVSGTPVKAPIVGTYYSKPRPDASPFVTVGSTVKKGDVLYILETMKVMNEITAETDGIVAKILVSDGDSLEYGQTVMIIG
ncbi:MAG: acetyl-CoA carboxylase biotin carboxyl carrier protein [Oscillospiraceae bacterium]